MKYFNYRVFCFFALVAVLSGFFMLSQSREVLSGQELTDAHKQEMQKIVHDYLMENPEIIMKSVEQYQVKQEQDKDKTAVAKAEEYKDYLTGDDAPSAGNPNGDVTVVEFFDYNCGYCKRALSDIQKIIDTDKNVRFVFQEMPILGPSSFVAAQWALAAHKQGKYFEYHTALMHHNGNKNEADLLKLAKNLGLDTDKMKQDANSSEIKSMLQKSVEVSREIGIQGTPAFILNGQIVRGYMGPEGLQGAIADARKKEG